MVSLHHSQSPFDSSLWKAYVLSFFVGVFLKIGFVIFFLGLYLRKLKKKNIGFINSKRDIFKIIFTCYDSIF